MNLRIKYDWYQTWQGKANGMYKDGQVQVFATSDWGKYVYIEQAYFRSSLYNTLTNSVFWPAWVEDLEMKPQVCSQLRTTQH